MDEQNRAVIERVSNGWVVTIDGVTSVFTMAQEAFFFTMRTLLEGHTFTCEIWDETGIAA